MFCSWSLCFRCGFPYSSDLFSPRHFFFLKRCYFFVAESQKKREKPRKSQKKETEIIEETCFHRESRWIFLSLRCFQTFVVGRGFGYVELLVCGDSPLTRRTMALLVVIFFPRATKKCSDWRETWPQVVKYLLAPLLNVVVLSEVGSGWNLDVANPEIGVFSQNFVVAFLVRNRSLVRPIQLLFTPLSEVWERDC